MSNGNPVETCRIFGTRVTNVTKNIAATPCGPGGDYDAFRDEDDFYKVSRGLRSVLGAKPLSDEVRGRVREWLSEQRRSEDCPLISSAVLRNCGASV